MLIMNIVPGIDGLIPKLQIRANLVSTLEICSDSYKPWHSQQIEHANYEYNNRQCLERLRDYWLRIVIGSE